MRGIPVDEMRLKALRRASHLTQEQLAEQSDCDTRTIRNAERGANIDVSTLHALANALGADVSELTALETSTIDGRLADIVSQWQQAFFASDCCKLETLYHHDATLALPSIPTIHGVTAIREAFELALKEYDYRKVDPASINVRGNRAFLESGKVEIATKSTRAKMLVSAVHVFEFSAELILRHTAFYDSLPLVELSGNFP